MICDSILRSFVLLAAHYWQVKADTVNLRETVQSTSYVTTNLTPPFQVGQNALGIESIVRPLKQYHTFSHHACALLCVHYYSLACVAFNYSGISQTCDLYEIAGLNLVPSIAIFNNPGQKYYYRLNMLNILASAGLSTNPTSPLSSSTTSSTTTKTTTRSTALTTASTTSSPSFFCYPNKTFAGPTFTFSFTATGKNVTCGCYNGILQGQSTQHSATSLASCFSICQNQSSPMCNHFAFSEADSNCTTSNGQKNGESGQVVTCDV